MRTSAQETLGNPAFVAASPSGTTHLGGPSIAATIVLLEVLRNCGLTNVTLTLNESNAIDGERAVRLIIDSGLLRASDWKPLSR